MRKNVSRFVGLSAASRTISLLAMCTILAGCSGSIDRFLTGYNNPADSDPVYTATLPKAKKSKQVAIPQVDDDISSAPLTKSRVLKPIAEPDFAAAPVKKTMKSNALALNETVDREPTYNDDATAVAEVNDDAAPVQAVAKGGKIRVEQGMTLYSIAAANGTSVKSLVKANGLRSANTLRVGQVLRIPGAKSVVVPRTTLAAQKKQLDVTTDDTIAVATKSSRGGAGEHTVNSGDTLYSIGRKFGVSPAVVADANGMNLKTRLTVGQTIKIPGAKSQVLAETTTDDAIGEAPAKVSEVPAIPEANQVAKLDAKKIVGEEVQETPPAQIASGMNLRWPLRGKIISEFGTKPGGVKNEGINIAVPEGTSVKAAESGVVAYAGNELKGYGNLILIRHEGGYVTAYAHAKELFVKKGAQVKRGDVIAKAGQTGAVDLPQLHFEVRKGATAMDPLKFLGNATASN